MIVKRQQAKAKRIKNNKKYKIIGCGLGASTLAERLVHRFPEYLELEAQIITADCDSNNFSKEIRIPHTLKGSGKSYLEAKETILPKAKNHLQSIHLMANINNSTVIILAACGGGSGNAIKNALVTALTVRGKHNNVIYVPILPMLQEGLSATANAAYTFEAISSHIVGTHRNLTVVPLNLESISQLLQTTDIHRLSSYMEELFRTTILFSQYYINSSIRSSFTVDESEYDSLIFGDSVPIKKQGRGRPAHIATRGYGAVHYSIADFEQVDDDEAVIIPNFDSVVPGLKYQDALTKSTDIVVTIALSSFSVGTKVRKAEKILLRLQKEIYQVNSEARLLTGLSVSPNARDHIYIAGSGNGIEHIAGYYYNRADENAQTRNKNVNASEKNDISMLNKIHNNRGIGEI